MSLRFRNPKLLRSNFFLAIAAVLIGLTTASSGKSDLTVKIEDSTNTPGGTSAFDIVVENTGSSTENIYAFSVEFIVSSPHITFTAADTSTTTGLGYIFPNNAVSGFVASNVTDQDWIVSDSYYATNGSGYQLAYQAIAPGETYALAHVTFSMSSSATGVYTTSVSPVSGADFNSNTSLTTYGPDGNGGIDYTTPLAVAYSSSAGTITAVPEPSTVLLGGFVICAGVLVHRRQKRHTVLHSSEPVLCR